MTTGQGGGIWKTDSTSVFAVPYLTILDGRSSVRQHYAEKSYPKLGGPCCIHFQKSEGSNRPTKNRRPARTRAPIRTGDSSLYSHDNSQHSTCRHHSSISTRARVILIPTIGGPFCILLPKMSHRLHRGKDAKCNPSGA